MKYILCVCVCVCVCVCCAFVGLENKKKKLFFFFGKNSLTERVFVTQVSDNAEMTA